MSIKLITTVALMAIALTSVGMSEADDLKEKAASLLKEGDKLLADAEKAKDNDAMSKSLEGMTHHCKEMIDHAGALVAAAGEHHDDPALLDLCSKLLKKSSAIVDKCKGFSEKFAKESPAKSEYVCPMHPDVKSDKPGKCSKCGMNLVKKAEAGGGHEGHKH